MTMISSGNDGDLTVGDEIDWTTIDYAEGSEMICDEKCDIQDFLESLDFHDTICPDLEYYDGATPCNDLLLATSAGHASCERKEATVEFSSAEISSVCAQNRFCDNLRPNKKKQNITIGPSHRRCKKKTKGLPKRPLSAYNLFFQSERLKIFEEGVINHERISFQGLAKLVGQRWQILDEEKRQELRRRSQDDIIRYQNEMKEYRENHCHDAALLMPRKRSPPNSPKSSKSTQKIPGSSKLKHRNCEASSFPSKSQQDKVGLLKNDSVILEHCDHVSDADDQCRLVSLPPLLMPMMANPLPLRLSDRAPSILVSGMPYDASVQTTCDRIDLNRRSGLSPINCQPPGRDLIGIYQQERLNFQTQEQMNRYPYMFQKPMNYVKTLPIGKEVNLYDPRTGIRRPYIIEFKCYAMARSDANAYIARYSYPGINGSHYVPLQRMLHAPPPPGVEVGMPTKKSSC
jgi:hypothetical protein